MPESLELLLLCVRMVIFMMTLGMLWFALFALRKTPYYSVLVSFLLAISLLLGNLVYGRAKSLLGVSSQGILELSVLLIVNVIAGLCIAGALVGLRYHRHD